MAVSMLLYSNERVGIMAFAAAVAIYSKLLFRERVRGGGRSSVHFLNPSNFGIVDALVTFGDWVSIAPPYQFTDRYLVG